MITLFDTKDENLKYWTYPVWFGIVMENVLDNYNTLKKLCLVWSANLTIENFSA